MTQMGTKVPHQCFINSHLLAADLVGRSPARLEEVVDLEVVALTVVVLVDLEIHLLLLHHRVKMVAPETHLEYRELAVAAEVLEQKEGMQHKLPQRLGVPEATVRPVAFLDRQSLTPVAAEVVLTSVLEELVAQAGVVLEVWEARLQHPALITSAEAEVALVTMGHQALADQVS